MKIGLKSLKPKEILRESFQKTKTATFQEYKCE